MNNQQNGRINSLTSLRFFAAALVVLHHMEFFQKSPSADVRTIFSWFFEGFVGVQFFYILSGFVISYNFADRSRKGPFPFSAFLFFRAARIFPIHWATLIIAAFLYVPLAGWDWPVVGRFIVNAALLQSYVPDLSFYFSFNAVSWSISTEMFFYLAFCLIVPFGTRALLAIWVGLLVIVFINVFNADLGNGLTGWFLYINPIFRFLDFLTGVMLYRLYVFRSFNVTRKQATYAELASMAAVVAFIVVAMILGVAIQWRWDIYYIPPIAFMIFVFALQRGAISQAICRPWLVRLGDASFALYMIHQIFIGQLVRWIDPTQITRIRYMIVIAAAILLATTLLSVVIYSKFEMPVNKRLRAWWLGRERKEASAIGETVA